jgi:hypothetical protein
LIGEFCSRLKGALDGFSRKLSELRSGERLKLRCARDLLWRDDGFRRFDNWSARSRTRFHLRRLLLWRDAHDRGQLVGRCTLANRRREALTRRGLGEPPRHLWRSGAKTGACASLRDGAFCGAKERTRGASSRHAASAADDCGDELTAGA